MKPNRGSLSVIMLVATSALAPSNPALGDEASKAPAGEVVQNPPADAPSEKKHVDVTYKYPVSVQYPKGVEKTFNANIFWIEDGEIHLTKEAMEAIDINSQKLNGAHTRAAIEAETDPEKRKAMLSQNLIIYVRHTADQHGMDNIRLSISLEIAVAKEMEKQGKGSVKETLELIDKRYKNLYGDDWKEKAKHSANSLSDINREVRKALGMPEVKPKTPEPATSKPAAADSMPQAPEPSK
jgi:hypothetical protein